MLQITLDGPSGSGKSTLAKIIADKLSITYLDTGAMYRALTYYCLDQNINLQDAQAVIKAMDHFDLAMQGPKVTVNGFDATEVIRTEGISKRVSEVASIKEVRAYMVDLQRQFAQNQPIVMDGRDIGTVVLPQAEFKFFITASVEERAKRRYEEQVAKGMTVNYEEIKTDIALRDEKDSTRKESPLVCADDAETINTTHMTIDDIVTYICNKVKP